MTIKTKIDIGDVVYFLFIGKIRSSKVTAIEIRATLDGISVDYLISENPCGDQYTRYFSETTIFKTKQELLNSL